MHTVRWGLLLLSLLWAPACQRPGGSPLPVMRTARPQGASLHALLREVGRAELTLGGGLLVDLGTPDQHKYLRGLWETGWGRSHRQGSTTFIEAHQIAWLDFVNWRNDLRALQIRLRAAGPAKDCKVLVGDRSVGGFAIDTSWSTHTVPFPAPLTPGVARLGLRCEGSATEPVAHVDWIWLGKEPMGNAPDTSPRAPTGALHSALQSGSPTPRAPAGALHSALQSGSPTPRVAPLRLDSPRRALVAAPARTYSFFLLVPAGASLVFDFGARRATRFSVQAKLDQPGPPRKLFEAEVGDGRWHQAKVDLATLAGQAIRLDLATRGDGEAGWAEPEIIGAPKPAVRVGAGLSHGPSAGPPARHLIQIMADAVRQDAYRPFNPNSRIVTPVLDRLAAGGTIYPNARTTANFTLPSVSAQFTGRYAWTMMANSETAKLPPEVPVLADYLRQQGFLTAAFLTNLLVSQPFGLERGWDVTLLLPRGMPQDAQVVFGKAVEWIREHVETAKQRRFFLYIHTMDAHSPYYFHEGITDGFLAGRPYRGGLRRYFTDADGEKPLDEEDQRYVRALYDGEIVYHDQHMGRLIDALKETGLLSQTLLVYTNDHGEELFDHGGKFHGHSLNEELLRCPLLLHYPPLFPAGQRVTDSVELVDLAPTVLEALGLPPLTRAHGRSLLQPPVPSLQYAVAQGEVPPHGLAFAVQVGPFKLLQWPEKHSLYDLRGEGADRADIAGDHPVALRLCQILLTEALAVPSKVLRQRGLGGGDRFKHHEAIVDPKTRKQLEALGYIK